MYCGFGNWVWDARNFCWKAPVGHYVIDLRPLPLQGIKGKSHNERGGQCLVLSKTPLNSEYIKLCSGDIREVKTTQKIRDAFRRGCGWYPQGDTVAQLIFDLLTRGSHPDGDLGVRPLMPTTEGLLTISGLYNKNFKFGYSSHTSMVRDVERLNYNYAFHNTKGRQYSKILDYMGHMYGVDNPHEVFIPSFLPKELALPHETGFRDTFFRLSEGTTIAGIDNTEPPFGVGGEPYKPWTETEGDSKILDTNLTCVTLGFPVTARYDDDLSSSNMETRIGSQATGGIYSFVGNCNRFSASEVTMYEAVAHADGDDEPVDGPGFFYHMYKCITTTRTELGSFTGINQPVRARDLRLNTSGSRLTFRDINTIDTPPPNPEGNFIDVTDTSITTGFRAGVTLRATARGNGAAGSFIVSDFEIIDTGRRRRDIFGSGIFDSPIINRSPHVR